jgi:transposase
MADLFGVKFSAATLANMSRSCAQRLEGFALTLRDHVAGAKVKHMDETGFRIGGKTMWLHVACATLLTFYRVCARRGSLLSDIVKVVGVIVHDHWKPYYTMEGVKHALCNAHHLRELKALVDPRT